MSDTEYDKTTIKYFYTSTITATIVNGTETSQATLPLVYNFDNENVYSKDFQNLVEISKKYFSALLDIDVETIKNIAIGSTTRLAVCTEYDFYTKGGTYTTISPELKLLGIE